MAESELPPLDAVQELEAAARQIIDRAVKELNTARLSKPTRLLAQAALTTLKRQRDYNDVITDVGRLTDEISKVSAVLEECAAALVKEEEETARRNPGSGIWWNTRSRAVRRALSAGQQDAALRRLTAAWVDGLASQDWQGCRSILTQPDFPKQLGSALDQMVAVTDALQEEMYARALDPLDGLLDPHGPSACGIDPEAAVRLGVLRLRILIREYSDGTLMRQSAEQTLDRAGTGDRRSLALTGLAEAQLATGEVDAARTTLAEATAVQPPATDALVAAGLLSERDGYSTTADEYYDRAVQADPAACTPALLRQVPPRLLLRAAKSAAASIEESLRLLDRIPVEEILGETDLERDVHLFRAEQLTKLAAEDEVRGQPAEAQRHRAEAAGSWVSAANRYLWSGLIPQALELFRRSCDLAPELAESHWAYAEGLRLDAFRADGTVDISTLWRANEEIRRGLNLRTPGSTEGPVLVTQALILEGLSDRRPDPALLVERALLKDSTYEVGYGFLTGILRRQGFPQEAFEASSDGRRTAGTSEPLLFEAHLDVLLDLDQYDKALKLIDHQAVRHPDEPELNCRRADVLLRKGSPDDALATLADQEPTYWMRMLRGYCQFAMGDAEACRQEFLALWNDTRDQPGGQWAGWAAFRAGLLEDAIAIYRDLHTRAPADAVITHDLGQMLLVRGDLAEGVALLEEGIDVSPLVSDLRQLHTTDFGYVRHATAGAAHAAEVADALALLSQRIEKRCTTLLGARRPADCVAAMLATARVAAHDNRPLEALAIYHGLTGNSEVPEAEQATIAAAEQVCATGDERFAEHQHDQALAHWSAATSALAPISPARTEQLRSLTCRRMLANLIDGTHEEVAAWLSEVTDDAGYRRTLLTAAGTLASDVSHLWALHDGLRAVADRAGTAAQQLAIEVADQLPFNQVYHLDAAEAVDYMFSFNNALELRFGSGTEQLRDSSELMDASSDLLLRIEDEFGVRIPWPYAVPGPRLAEHEVEVRVYVGWVGKTLLTGPAETWLSQVMTLLEDRVRNYLFRLISVDDVPLWLEGWDAKDGDALRWEPADPRADRLRLARVLRMLLRERVSVKDRRTIVEVVHSPTAAGKQYDSATLKTLRAVRRRLGAAALGVGPDTVVVPLPLELADRVGKGLAADRPVWELPRQQACQLVADLRSWLHELPATPAAISVADGRLRPFVWRLLAAEPSVVRVLAEEELS
jgi:tetratricopeptide (TPR) repeat protein